MTRKLLTLICLPLLAACARDNTMSGMDHSGTALTPDTIPASAVDLKNTVCVVSGDPVGSSKLFALYDGKVYHFCCSDCPKDFANDPAKYAKLIAADPAKYGVAK